MRYLSVCSGIEAATVAWHPLGWQPVALSEVDAFPSAVLKHHYPNTPNWGDMTKFAEWPDAAVNVLVGGTPCQSFSVAGLRKGLDDPRGNLMLTFGAIAQRYRPQWLVWENVPGVLSSNGGRDFGTFLGMLGELGYGFAYRVLDAQYFGVAQRRRRVFVVGCLGDWRRAAAVLFERHSLQGHPAPRREARKDTAGSTGGGVAYGGNNTRGPIDVATAVNACGTASGRQDFESETFIAHALRGEGVDASEDGSGRGTPLVPVSVALRGRDGGATAEIGDDLAFSLRASSGGGDKPHVMAHAFDARQSDVIQYGDKTGPLDTDGHSVAVAIQGALINRSDSAGPAGSGVDDKGAMFTLTKTDVHAVAVAFSAKDYGGDAGDIAPTLRAGGHAGSHANGGVMPAVAFQPGNLVRGAGSQPSGEVFPTLKSDHGRGLSDQHPHVMAAMQVRRLTPRECERLQGFPDDYTQIPYRNKPAGQCPDGPRYKALGNSMAVPVMRWIGERIAAVQAISEERRETA